MPKTAVDTQVHDEAGGARKNRLYVALRVDVAECQTDLSVGVYRDAGRGEVASVSRMPHVWKSDVQHGDINDASRKKII